MNTQELKENLLSIGVNNYYKNEIDELFAEYEQSQKAETENISHDCKLYWEESTNSCGKCEDDAEKEQEQSKLTEEYIQYILNKISKNDEFRQKQREDIELINSEIKLLKQYDNCISKDYSRHEQMLNSRKDEIEGMKKEIEYLKKEISKSINLGAVEIKREEPKQERFCFMPYHNSDKFHILEKDEVAVKNEDLKRWIKDSISQGRYEEKAISMMFKEMKKYLEGM